MAEVLDKCRLCFNNLRSDDEDAVNLFQDFLDSGSYADQLLDTFQLQLKESPGWPTLACPECLSLLQSMTSFKERILTTHDKLLSISPTGTSEIEEESALQGLSPDEIWEECESEVPPQFQDDFLNESDYVIEEESLQADIVEEEPLESDEEDIVQEEDPEEPEEKPKRNPRRKFEKFNTLDRFIVRTSERAPLEEHMLKMNVLKCSKCKAGPMTSISELFEHLEMDHETERQDMSIVCCSKTIGNIPDIYDHFRLHLNEDFFKCDHCEFRGEGRQDLVKHCTAEHGDYRCETCGKAFKHSFVLSRHLKIHLDRDQRPDKCSYCGKGFVGLQALQRHIERMHEKEARHICEICGKVFSNRSTLSMHVSYHNNKSQTKRDRKPCPICGKMVVNVKAHMNWSHLKVDKNSKPLDTTEKQCSVCLKYIPGHRFYHHMYTHSRKQMCPICHKVITYPNMKHHLDMHNGIKIRCSFCPSVMSKKNLARHLQLKHPDEVKQNKKGSTSDK